MSYELFRTKVYSELHPVLDESTVESVLKHIDAIATDFDIEQKCHDLTLYTGVPPLVKDYIASCMIRRMNEDTIKTYYDRLEKFFQAVKKPFDQVTSNDVRVYLLRYGQTNPVEPSTLNAMRSCFKSFYDWCVDEDYLQKNPCKNVDRIKEPKHEREGITQYELEQVRSVCTTERDLALVDVFVSTGVRVSECVAIKLSDIDWRERSIKIMHGKGDKERTVFFNEKTEHSIKRYLDSREDSTDALFVSERRPHRAIKKGTVQSVIRRIAQEAVIKHKLSPHVLRHTFATVLLDNGMPLEQLQTLLGHVNPATTLIYAKINRKDVQRNHQKYSI